jgi:hypothetical protein
VRRGRHAYWLINYLNAPRPAHAGIRGGAGVAADATRRAGGDAEQSWGADPTPCPWTRADRAGASCAYDGVRRVPDQIGHVAARTVARVRGSQARHRDPTQPNV